MQLFLYLFPAYLGTMTLGGCSQGAVGRLVAETVVHIHLEVEIFNTTILNPHCHQPYCASVGHKGVGVNSLSVVSLLGGGRGPPPHHHLLQEDTL